MRQSGVTEMARILIIDDSPEICDTLRAALEHGGHEVEDTSNFQCALRTIQTGDYDVLIADGWFPKHPESGPEPLGPELLRRASGACRVRILHSGDATLSTGARGNGIKILPKCSSLREILAAVEGR